MDAAEVLHYAAFTADPRGGNPAGIVPDATDFTPEGMRRVAELLGYSETAFVFPGPDPRRPLVRYFSPKAEVPFCGHATIATGAALAARLGAGEFVFTTRAGEVPVHTELSGGVASATLTSVPATFAPVRPAVLAEALTYLNYSREDLDPVRGPLVGYAGAHHLVLPVATRERLAELSYEFGSLASLMAQEDWTTVQLVWFAPDGTVHSRNPFPVGGVVEDPATGAAAAALGGCLRPGLTAPARLTVRQGEDMGRPSLLLVDIDPADPRIRVTGQAVPLAH
ncbi:PhzF family phenazine biosynthesis protein [Crossiella equi]|uniref:PhzF family phenazine biosynthesis protein n=1 Tax=Crossiella equi TaxID=130796 RepID=A0ABS5AQ56_9PSEU|nr:PhzF family phenazine biosynthesis isomerase [Crossiella equi]MBP2478702.1 PhzF family phenazine biosynthesis protein [Crossiella equi]